MSRYRRQFPSPVQFREDDRIPPVGLDPIPRFAWNQRGSDHNAVMSRFAQLPLNTIAARSCFITKPQLAPTIGELGRQLLQGSRCVDNLAMLANLASLASLGKRHCNRVFVNIKPNKNDNLTHDPSPMHEARHRTILCNPRIPAYCETGRPYLRRTCGLWSRILDKLPCSRLLLKTTALGDLKGRQRLLRQFADNGIAADRLLLERASPRAELLPRYNRLDVALDPTPYGGGTTTAEALWMGVPVVTLRGKA